MPQMCESSKDIPAFLVECQQAHETCAAKQEDCLQGPWYLPANFALLVLVAINGLMSFALQSWLILFLDPNTRTGSKGT